MAILAQCPVCPRKHSNRNKLCSCGKDLMKAKKSRKVKYWISYYLPVGKKAHELVGTSIEEARQPRANAEVRSGTRDMGINRRLFLRGICQACLVMLMAVVPMLPSITLAAVVHVEVDSRDAVLGGKPFGHYGAYELLKGRMHFAFDPANPLNPPIVDLELAPRDADGFVEAWANFVVLQPAERSKARRIALVEVSNRGSKIAPRWFNRASGSDLDPGISQDFGDELLMRLGLTVIWVGWQFDVPLREGALRLHVPRAQNMDGTPIHGLVRSDWTLDESTKVLKVSHRDHIPYPVSDPDHPDNVLTVRDGREAPRRVVPRQAWQFAREVNGEVVADPNHIYMSKGFEPGKIYELVYRSKDPAVVGLGLAAIRDVISYAKYDKGCLFPARLGIAFGVSQTGRFLRHFLYEGFNTDEKGRKAYDGLMVIIAGAGRGSFNHRFAQPSRDAHRYSAFFYPTDIFPFTSVIQQDPEQWRSDGLLANLHNPEHAPKTFYINTGYEYWGRAASLIHTSVDGSKDVEPLASERIYHIASGQHFVIDFPHREQARMGDYKVYRGNPLEFNVNLRALLVRLVEWVEFDTEPPSSLFPRIDAGTLVPISMVRFPAIPGVLFPRCIHVAYRADYGPRWCRGIIDFEPPKLGKSFPALVSQVDALGSEIGGVRNVELRVPLATYTPWNLRVGYPGNSNELVDFFGTFIPLPRTEAEKSRTGDPRPSIASLYTSRDDYLGRIRYEALGLVDEGFLLEEDVNYVERRAGRSWDWILGE